MIRELDVVALARDLPRHGLKAGDVGTVVLVHPGSGYEVEFVTLKGESLAVISLSRRQVRSIKRGEIASARRVGSVA